MKAKLKCKSLRAYFSDGSEFILPRRWEPEFERFYQGRDFAVVQGEILNEVDRIFSSIRRGSRTKASICEEVMAGKIKEYGD